MRMFLLSGSGGMQTSTNLDSKAQRAAQNLTISIFFLNKLDQQKEGQQRSPGIDIWPAVDLDSNLIRI